jgi:putative DNA helicase
MVSKSDGGKALLTRIKNNKKISNNLINLLYFSQSLSSKDAEFLFSVALLLIEEFERKREQNIYLLIEYAYLIIARTCFKIKDFRALYDFSINYGYYPIARKILSDGLLKNNISVQHLISNNDLDDFSEEGKIKTYEQHKVFEEIIESKSEQLLFAAPTSYGKSELIFKHLSKNNDKSKVAIIVPTKALIDQTFRDAKQKVHDRKILIHDQNYNVEKDNRILAIVTQERALRLIDEGIVFEMIYIDEAHELLDFNFRFPLANRSLLLARFINITRKLNPQVKLIYLSPTIQNSESLLLADQDLINDYRIEKNLKILEIKYLSKENKEYIYDLYLNEYILVSEKNDPWKYIVDTVSSGRFKKNLHFIFRPKQIEDYSQKIFDLLPERDIPEEIKELQEELSRIVHPEFKLINYLSKGIVYLHGVLPLLIRNYLLKYIKESKFLSNFIANSVVLAGMNLPIDNLIYISGFNRSSDLKNLIGRVNRLNEIFKKESSLSRIFIPIHFIELIDYPQYNGCKIQNKITSLRGAHKDNVENPILKKFNNDNAKATVIRDYEEDIIREYNSTDFRIRLSKSGAQQLLNYTEEGIIKLQKVISETNKIEGFDNLIQKCLEKIRTIFFEPFIYEDYKLDNNYFQPTVSVSRLRYLETCNYYKKFLENSHLPLSERVNYQFDYWKQILNKKRRDKINYFVYVGTQFGEVPYATDFYSGNQNVYIDLRDHKNDSKFLYNIAIIKIQKDEDFISHEITLLLNALKEFKIINENQFDYFLYGTQEPEEISILRLGISKNMYESLKKENQIRNIGFDEYGNPKANKALKEFINSRQGIEKFELEQFFL